MRKLLSSVHRNIYREPFSYMLRNEGCRAISVRHVSTGDDFIDSCGIFFLVLFLATKEHWHHLQMILSCQGDQYGCYLSIILDSIDWASYSSNSGGMEQLNRTDHNTISWYLIKQDLSVYRMVHVQHSTLKLYIVYLMYSTI